MSGRKVTMPALATRNIPKLSGGYFLFALRSKERYHARRMVTLALLHAILRTGSNTCSKQNSRRTPKRYTVKRLEFSQGSSRVSELVFSTTG